MLAMTLATLGWAVWWAALLLRRFWPDQAPGLVVTEWTAGAFAVPGFLLAFLSLRAQKSWFFFACVALFANGSLFLMPWIAGELLR